MKTRSIRFAHAVLLGVLTLAAPVTAQDDPQKPKPTAAEQEEAREAAQKAEQFTVPADVAQALEIDAGDMRETLAAASPDKLSAVLGQWMALTEAQQARYETALGAPDGSAERATADAIGTDRDALIARAEGVIELLVKSGGDVTAARASIQDIREAETAQEETATTVPPDQTKAQTVDVEVLRAQLRPLTVEQVAGELADWMALLQKKCFEVRKAEVAGLLAEEGDDISKFNAAAVALRAERDRLLKRVRVVIDAFETKGGDEAKAKEHRAYTASIVVTPPVTGFRAAWTTFSAWLTNPDGGIALGVNLGLFALILVCFRLLAAVLSGLMNRALRAVGRTPELLRAFFVSTVRKITMLVGIVVALGQIGVNMGPLVAAIGGAAFVIGFALQGTLSNFASGLMILMYRPYNVGDVVEIGGTLGKVDGQNLVSTTIKTFDNKVIVVPNNKIWGDVITNATASKTRRVDLVFGIGYDDDIATAEEVLRDIVTGHDKVLEAPAPVIRLHELGDSSVNFVVRPWTRTADYWDVYWDITRAVKERFDAAGVSIPFPQRDVHLHQDPATTERTVVLPGPPATSGAPRASEGDAVPLEGSAARKSAQP